MDLFIRFLIPVLLGLVLGGSAQISQKADLFLNQIEANLLELVDKVRANALNSCELLTTCNAESTCSRLSCPLMHANTAGYECVGVLRNTNCKDNCSSRNFDFSQSFLSVPGVDPWTINSTTQRLLQGICAQRNLDSFFQKHSNNTHFFSLYFGSVDGTSRFFPGLEESDCGSYDPRTRLWYLKATTDVKKAVMVLIDRGESMTKPIGSTSNDSNLATAFRITESLLKTTTENDYVNIFTFDKTNVNFSSDQPVLVTDTYSHPDFEIFNATLSSPIHNSPGTGNITDAISEVITSSAGFNGTNISSDFLKVILLITDSNQQAADTINNAALPWDLIKSNNISVFFYMIPPIALPTDVSLRFASQLCAAGGNFEILDESVFGNPLLALEAYFSFVANVHATYVNGGIEYTPQYPDSSDVDDETFTLSKAVFNNNKELLGVAAIDIFKTKVLEVYGIDGHAFDLAIRNRENQTSDFYTSIEIDTTMCFNQPLNKICDSPANLSNIICSSTFDADITTLQELSCCGACAGGNKKPHQLPLALGLGLGTPVLLLVVATMACLLWRRQHQQNARHFHFPGDPTN